jgi:hypothetical protein
VTRNFRVVIVLAAGILAGVLACAISGVAETQSPHDVPSIDAGAGPCTADMTVTDAGGKPVYAATIRVHIAYGFMGVRKMDLEIGTNVDGKARFLGLPDKLNKTLYFQASKGSSKGAAFDNPAKHCHSQHSIVLEKQ